MDTNSLKNLVAEHFDYAPQGTGQFLHGDWFTPKHKDSLAYVLDELVEDEQDADELRDDLSASEKKVEAMEEEAKDKEKELDELDRENARLESQVRMLKEELAELKREGALA